jgi:predicted nucleic acid-binding protein
LHRDGHIGIVVSQQVLDELIRNLRDKLPSGLPVLQHLLNATPPEIVADPAQEGVDQLAEAVNFDDAPILAAALAAEVDFLVTGDRTFLREARKAQTDLVALSPREFLDQFEADE